MRKTLFCGVDLHSNNALYVITDQEDKQLFKRRLPNQLPVVLESLEPFRPRLKVVGLNSGPGREITLVRKVKIVGLPPRFAIGEQVGHKRVYNMIAAKSSCVPTCRGPDPQAWRKEQ